MKKLSTVVLALVMACTAGVLIAQEHPEHPEKKKDHPTKEHPEGPQMPQPAAATDQHKWLAQLAGEWDYTIEMAMMPDMKMQGTESCRMIGDLWLVADTTSVSEMGEFAGHLTLGFDPEKGKFVGTWIDSMGTHMWQYTGEFDARNNAVVLRTSGPNMMTGQGTAEYKEVSTLIDKNHKKFTSAMKMEDGSWNTFMTIHYTRKAGTTASR